MELVESIGDKRYAIDISLENLKWKRQLVLTWSRLEYNTKTNLKETGYEGVGWINLARDMDLSGVPVNTVVTTLPVPRGTY